MAAADHIENVRAVGKVEQQRKNEPMPGLLRKPTASDDVLIPPLFLDVARQGIEEPFVDGAEAVEERNVVVLRFEPLREVREDPESLKASARSTVVRANFSKSGCPSLCRRSRVCILRVATSDLAKGSNATPARE